MDGKLALHFVALSVVLHSATCGQMFFHEPSAILVRTTPDPNADFGFAIQHWNDSLIVSSPSIDLIGKVYKCPLAGILDNSLNCSSLELFNTTNYVRNNYEDQKYFLGASMAATKDYLFTCAPLVVKSVWKTSGKDAENYTDAVGSCFVYSNNISYEYKGPEERFIKGDDTNSEKFTGGTGWNTFADEKGGYLIVAKTSVYGDINYLRTSEPLKMTSRVGNTRAMSRLSNDVIDLGYGITAGKFFSDQTVYAFSKQSNSMTGQILFLKEKINSGRIKTTKVLNVMMKKGKKSENPLMISNEVVGAMFGYALGSADLNSDGLSELLVGAPLQSEDMQQVEFGALHIYLGGDKTKINNPNRIRTIFGVKNEGRFGSTIATTDLDGDSLPEVFVSAPYEDKGVVYILSGHELREKLIESTIRTMQVSKLEHIQKVARGDLAVFGFSLLSVPDVDSNGCNELAIGAPNSASVLLLRSIQRINVTVTSELVGTDVRERDDNCTIKVCVNIDFDRKFNLSGYISVKNYMEGLITIRDTSYQVDLSTTNGTNCRDIIIDFRLHEMSEYNLKTWVELQNIKSLENKEFDVTWVQLSTYSVTECNLPISRRCNGHECTPQLSVHVHWNHIDSTHVYDTKGDKKKTYERRWYEVESSKEETVSVVVKNTGFQTSQACAWVDIAGAPVHKPGNCAAMQSPRNIYKCMLPTYFRRGDSTTFDISLNMTRLSNADKQLVVVARINESCYLMDNGTGNEETMLINYDFRHAWQKVQLEGKKHDIQVSDLAISGELEMNEDDMLTDDQEYWIINDEGSVIWNRAVAVIEVEKRTFINRVYTTENCSTLEGDNKYTITCSLVLPPGDTKKIVASAEMSRKEIGQHLKDGHHINVTSHMKIFMDPAVNSEYNQISLVTDIKIDKDFSFKNNKLLIGLVAGILAILLLALVIFILYKRGFFKREEKKKLNVLRESVRRRSIRLASDKSSRHSQKSPSNADDDHDIDIEVVEDCPFEEIPISSKDDVVLVNAQADVHHEEAKQGKKERIKSA